MSKSVYLTKQFLSGEEFNTECHADVFSTMDKAVKDVETSYRDIKEFFWYGNEGYKYTGFYYKSVAGKEIRVTVEIIKLTVK